MKKRYSCQLCGAVHSSWSGKCLTCGEWNSLAEDATTSLNSGKGSATSKLKLESHKQILKSNLDDQKRILIDIGRSDEVLGGGLVKGSIIMVTGEPGIGKSTFLAQLAGAVSSKEHNVIYVSAEESIGQVALRFDRLKIKSEESLKLSSSFSAEAIADEIRSSKPTVCIVDSIQTIRTSRITSLPGTLNQVSNSLHVLAEAANEAGTTLVLVGHVTKDGSMAGPKLLEHLVDVVLFFEGNRYGEIRVLKALKNRYGPTTESALFAMGSDGLNKPDSLSNSLLLQRGQTDGSVVTAIVEGSESLLVEVQALVIESNYGFPKRSASGFDLSRLNIIIATINKRTKLDLSNKDVFINIAGGIKIKDSGADLGICLAIASALKKKIMPSDAVVFGEVGLGGEVRSANYSEKRISEAIEADFSNIILPKKNYESTKNSNKFLMPVKSISEAIKSNL